MKMLAWPNTKRSSRVYLGLLYVQQLKRGRQAALRRRNRAREDDALRRELARDDELLPCPEPGCHPRHHDARWDMNDEYQAPSDAVWRALVENDDGLRFVDFNGTYTVTS